MKRMEQIDKTTRAVIAHDSCFLVFTTGTLCRSIAAGDLQGNPI